MASNLNHSNLDILINRALAIEDEMALDADALGFMARAMVQATLPHSKVEGNEFTRKNGNYSLTILSPSTIGLPYGSVPRLLLAWVTTEAVKTKSKELELGDSLSGFMRELDLVPTGGRWGSITRLKEQTKRLFASSITAIYEQGDGTQIINQSVADRAVFWWHPKDPNQTALWKSSISLTENFYREIVDRPVPIDMRAIKALKKSPMALDIYTWLTYRVSYLKKPISIPWASLAMQFGSNYSRVTDFRASFLSELKKVVTVYGGVQIEVLPNGLVVKPSLTHIARKADK
jgi:hypothetical protein